MQLDERGGFPTCWSVRGKGAREVLAIHCSLAHKGAWNGVAAALEDVARITAFDLPGHGGSADWPGGDDLHVVATDMAADFLDRPMDVIGHSFGAVVALSLALSQPGKVRSLVMIDPVFFAAIRLDDARALEDWQAHYRAFPEAVAAGDYDRAAREFTRDWGAGQPWEALDAAQRAYLVERIRLVPLADRFLFEDAAGLLPRLGALGVPVLLVEGARTPAIMGRVCDALQKHISGARRRRIEDAGHMAPITHPAQTAAAIRAFWEAGAAR